MADRKITDLTALAAGSQATGDLLTIVDVSEAAAVDKNKKITVESLFKGIPSSVGVGVASPTFPSGTGIEINDSSTPRLKLSNNTTGTGSTDGSYLYVSGSDFLIENKESANMRFYTSASERLRIDSSGNVGIGTTSPSQSWTGGSSRTQQLSGLSGQITVLRVNEAGGAGGDLQLVSSTSAEAAVYNFANGSLRFGTNATERMRIASNGNVGIGTASPAGTLGVDGAAFFGNQSSSGSTDGVLRIVESTSSIYLQTGTNTSTGSSAALVFSDINASNEWMRITNSGSVGIGTNGPAAKLELRDNTQALLSWGDTAAIGSLSFDGSSQPVVRALSGKSLVFHTNGSNERARIDSSGRLLVGTTSATHGSAATAEFAGTNTDYIFSLTNSTASDSDGHRFSYLAFTGTQSGGEKSILASVNGAHDGTADDTKGMLVFRTNSGSEGGTIPTERMRIDSSGNVGIGNSSPHNSAGYNTLTLGNGTSTGGQIHLENAAGNNFYIWHDSNGANLYTESATSQIFYTNATERMRIDSSGNVLVGKTSNSTTVQGTVIYSNGSAGFTATSGITGTFNRLGTDGTLINFVAQSVIEGSIGVSGTTVSYNGAHLSRWSQLPGGVERTEILRGSVLSNLDEMCEWGDEDNEQLNRMQVSDVEGDPNVAGVFQAWDDDDDTYDNDFYCAMTGDFVIRIAQGTTVARGDLLMSAGDGTAKPQDDDIVRSKTIAKVTSTTVSTTYADGSYCVPCVLMAC